MITLEMILLWAIVAGAVVLFSIDIFPVDKVSFLVLGALAATGLVQSNEAISGFGNPATITVASMLVGVASLTWLYLVSKPEAAGPFLCNS